MAEVPAQPAPPPGPEALGARPDAPARKRVSLALQGGGAHGAFTWGVLDAFLEDGRLEVEAISGTSAGAINAVLLLDGLADGGPEAARAQLRRFWRRVSRDGAWSTPGLDPLTRLFTAAVPGPWPGARWLAFLGQFASPYDLNPLDLNPLRGLLEAEIDFARLRAGAGAGPKLFLAATDVRTGKVKLFGRPEITAAHVLASACLPQVFQAVEIDGAAYWDGGYLGNPALFPLFYEAACDDVILVQVNPARRGAVPRDAHAIQNRLNEITFNAALLGEFRAVAFVQRLLDRGLLPAGEYKRVRMHRVAGGDALAAYDADTKSDTAWSFFEALHALGREAGRAFLAAHFADIGVRDSFDLAAEIA